MKIILSIAIALFGVVSCLEYHRYPAPAIDYKKLAAMTPFQIDQYAGGLAAEELIRSKRSGSSGFFSHISQSITSGISKASAGASSSLSSGSAAKGLASASGSSSGSSSSSSSSGYGASGGGGYDYHKPKATGSTDFFSLKKSILNTIFQALKAITGGVTILKGQLIKGGGALTSGVGNLISVKGEAVANLGRHLVNSASLSPPKGHSAPEVHISPSAPTHYGPPSAPPSSYGPPSSHGPPSSPASNYGSPPLSSYSSLSHSSHNSHSSANIIAPHSSFIPPSSASPVHFATGPSANLIHSTSQSIYPSHSSSVYSAPLKHLASYEATGHDSSKYSPNGLQAGIIFMKNIEMPHHSPNYYNSHGNFVTTAVDALHGILKPGNVPPTAPVEEPSAHDILDTNNIYSPPPSPHGHVSSSSESLYASHHDSYVPFKPLNLDAYQNTLHSTHESFSKKSDDDHGTFLSKKLTEMIDDLLGVKHPPKKHHSMPPLSSLLYDSKPSYSSPTIAVKKPGLNPIKLAKVNENLDKLQAKLERKDSGRSMSSAFDTIDSLQIILKAIQEGKEKMMKELAATSKSAEVITTTKSTSNVTDKEIVNSKHDDAPKHIVQKSLVYELRGDKLVQLTDDKTDNS